MEHLLQQMWNGTELIPIGGFNPYFYGTSTSTETMQICFAMSIEFQSLFLWNIYFNIF